MRLLPAAALIAGVALSPAAPSFTLSIDASATPARSGSGAGPALDPVWSRQNVWMPWARWNPQDSSTLPRFDAYVKEIALIMATGFRPDSVYRGQGLVDASVPDLYRDSAGLMLPFDPKHPFFNALRLLKAKGIRPVIDLGPVPRALCRKPALGPFLWNTAAPEDYSRYHDYIKALFLFLQGPAGFTKRDVESWKYQLIREPDNHESWNPREAKHSIDSGNLEEYKKLYDFTLAGMRAAGLRVNLSFGNLMVAYPGVWIFKDSWLDALCRHLADTSMNLAPGLLRLPRIASTSDTLLFSFTAYGGKHTQLEADPRTLAAITRRFRSDVRAYFPKNPLEITVGEGNLLSDKLHHRSDGSEMGAAWTAAIYKTALDAGLHRYQQWGFVSASHASIFNEGHGLQSGPFNVVQLYLKLAIGKRVAVALKPPDPLPAPGYADALATRSGDGVLRVLAFHYRPQREPGESLAAEINVKGLVPGKAYAIRRYRIDRDRGQYLNRWHRDLKAAGETLPVPFDACMEYQFNTKQWELWRRNQPVYESLSLLTPLPAAAGDRIRTDAEGGWSGTLALPSNSVLEMEFRPVHEE